MEMGLHIVILNLSIGPFMTHFNDPEMEENDLNCFYSISANRHKQKDWLFMEKYASKHF